MCLKQYIRISVSLGVLHGLDEASFPLPDTREIYCRKNGSYLQTAVEIREEISPVNSEIRQKAATELRWLSEDVNSIRSSKQ